MEDAIHAAVRVPAGSRLPAGLLVRGNTSHLTATLHALYSVPELRRSMGSSGIGLALELPPAHVIAALMHLSGQAPQGAHYDQVAISAVQQHISACASSDAAASGAETARKEVFMALSLLHGALETSAGAADPALFLTVLRAHFPRFGEQRAVGPRPVSDALDLFLDLLGSAPPVSKLGWAGVAAPSSVHPRSLVSQVFTGEMAREQMAGDAAAPSSTAEECDARAAFTKLVCQVDESSSLYAALDRAIKSDSARCIARLPYYLAVVLERSGTEHAAKPVQATFNFDALPYCSAELRAQAVPVRRAMAQYSAAIGAWDNIPVPSYLAPYLAPAPADEVASAGPIPTSQAGSVAEGGPVVCDNVTGFYYLHAIVTRNLDSDQHAAWTRHGEKWVVYENAAMTDITWEDVAQLVDNGSADGQVGCMYLYKAMHPAPEEVNVPL